MAGSSGATGEMRWPAMAFAVATAFVTASAFAPPAGASLYGFECITHNLSIDAAIGEAQLFVDVTAEDVGVVRFTFLNIGDENCAICDVYFDDGPLFSMAQLIDADDGIDGDPLVDFSEGASPPVLPGGQLLDPPFEVTSWFVADFDSNPPTLANGVGPGESLGIEYTLESGIYYSDVIDYLNDGRLRIGIHVQGFDSSEGGSESFVHVPAPGAATLGLAGIGMIGWLKRRYI